MTDQTQLSRPETTRPASESTHGAGSQGESRRENRRTESGARGRTTIADGVVAKIAGLAARSVPGVQGMGGGFTRGMGTVRERVPGAGGRSVTGGVKVEVGEVQTAVDLSLIVEYGFPIVELTGDVRTEVIAAIERMTGLEVVEVDITVTDVKLPDEEEEEQVPERRVVQ
ncbi:Asp23/Gls24 family envelope stress response protein [Streptomyces sp. NBC_01717]|uniref:Asp23/Gls24 family envelope stress response protein n=1 Tax=Streptomyces sp. NBC_01717 TaxID=2975918 RepID=UPI002E333F2C|nr:Asp23/Gls24 family envelope stress response protein [Streptomyces sp. NBC_01717]